uniref:Tetrahydromethanopterin S-methyltransferase subunit C n=1 Tax=Uncultured archaeon GZfos26G2 TaxID=3386331 RepID=Q64ED0_UNCAG|nr:N(5)-methyl-tetrahydromethanopterin-coenzyme M methyltransferase subunit C [uncultured archaeon GZfos12E2]
MGEEEVKQEEKEEKAKPKEKFKLSFDYFNESRLGIFALIIGILVAIFPGLPAFIKAIGMMIVFVWGADSVRKTARYGLGTGVPSIGVLAMGFGIIGAITGIAVASLSFGTLEVLGGVEIAFGVLAGVALLALLGFVSGNLANGDKFINMKIPGLERGMTELGMAGTLAVLIEISIVVGAYDATKVLPNVINNGVIAVIFIISAFAMLQPYNTCLGADERRGRTLLMSIEIGGIASIILGIATTVTLSAVQGVPLLVLGAVVWVVFYRAYMKACLKEAYAVKGTGLIKTLGG